MTLTYRQARAILFGLSSLSLLTSFLLVILMPNVNEIPSSHEETLGDDRISQHLLTYETKHGLNANKDYNIRLNGGDGENRHSNRQRRERQQRQAYLPDELSDIMMKQQKIQQVGNNEHDENENNNKEPIDNNPVSIKEEQQRSHQINVEEKHVTFQTNTEEKHVTNQFHSGTNIGETKEHDKEINHNQQHQNHSLQHQNQNVVQHVHNSHDNKSSSTLNHQVVSSPITVHEQLSTMTSEEKRRIDEQNQILYNNNINAKKQHSHFSRDHLHESDNEQHNDIHLSSDTKQYIGNAQNQGNINGNNIINKSQQSTDKGHGDIPDRGSVLTPVDSKQHQIESKMDTHSTSTNNELDKLGFLHSTIFNKVTNDQTVHVVPQNTNTIIDVRTRKAGLFVLLADSRSGSEWIMSALNNHPSICCATNGKEMFTADNQKILLGGLPTSALSPTGMPWYDDTSIIKSCSLEFIQQQIFKMIRHMAPASSDGPSMPRSCREINPANPLYPNHVLQRLCQFITRLNGNYTKASISSQFVDSFLTSEVYSPTARSMILDSGCICPDTTTVRGVKILSDWGPQVLQLMNSTNLNGSKVIRLTRKDLLARYMSLKIAKETNRWQITSLSEKQVQMQLFLNKYNRNKYQIDIDDLLQATNRFQVESNQSDEIARQHGSDVLFIDYDECRDNSVDCFQKITNFLHVDFENNRNVMLQSSSTDYAEYNSGRKILDQIILNRGPVQETLSTFGWNPYVKDGFNTNKHDEESQTEIQLLMFGDNDNMIVRRQFPKGINMKYVKNTRIDFAKFSPLIIALRAIPPEALVVVSTGKHISINNRIRSDTDLLESIAQFRSSFEEITKASQRRTSNGPVVIATDSRCCSTALTHAKPGDYFSKTGKRSRRSCTVLTDKDACAWLGDQFALPWQMFMKELALDRSVSPSPPSNVYLDATLVVGKARDIVQLFVDVDIRHSEDEHAVLTDFMFYDNNRIMLDYDQKLFGRVFEGVRQKVRVDTTKGCVGGGGEVDFDDENEETREYIAVTPPLFLSNRRNFECTPNSLTRDQEAEKSPVWDHSGITITPILEHVDRFFIQGVSLPKTYSAEMLYIIDGQGVWIGGRRFDSSRVDPINKLITYAHKELTDNKDVDMWRSLRKAFQSAGFLFWGWYGDYKDCIPASSTPLLTTRSRIDCNNAFLVPSIPTIVDSKLESNSWYKLFQSFDNEYPWSSKIRKVFWRGNMTEMDSSTLFDSTPLRLAKLVSRDQIDFFDVGFFAIPPFASSTIDPSMIGGIKTKLHVAHQAQRYFAVLDMDDQVWTSRITSLLCYNSVIIKVEPEFVDYFFYDLKPWKHYVPVKSDLSDLMENVRFVMDPKNDASIREIVASANQFCAERFVTKQLALDLLHVWNSYVQNLDIADSSWEQKWSQKKAGILSSKLYGMIKLEAGSI